MELTIEQALQQGIAAHKEGNLQDAERLYRAILQSQPLHADANHNLGVLAVSVDKADAALPLFKTALEANPKIEQFWLSYIDAFIKEKQFDNASQVLEQAKKQGVAGEKLNALKTQLILTIQVNEPKLFAQKESLTLSEKRKKLAENKKKKGEIQNLKGISPSETDLNNLLQYYQAGRYGDAEKLAASITQEFPKHQFGWKVLGAVLKQTGRVRESLVPNQKAAALSPQDSEAHSNLGNTLKELGRLDEAEASYTQAIVLKPGFAEANFNKSIAHLLLSDFEAGWPAYEWRFLGKITATAQPRKHLAWDGKQSLEGKRFLIYDEQGLGDVIQFCRYLSILQKNAQVTFKLTPKLHALITNIDSDISLSSTLLEESEIDFEAPLMSLPFLMGTAIDTIPAPSPYLFADEGKVKVWQKNLHNDKFKIGIC